MSINRISQSQARETQAVQALNSQESRNAENKANAVDAKSSQQVHAEPVPQKLAAKVDSDAGREEGRQESTGNDTNSSRLNVFA
jgi:hypothetical protein